MIRYIYKVLYRGKEIDKIDIIENDRDIAEDNARSYALDNLDVAFEEEIEDE